MSTPANLEQMAAAQKANAEVVVALMRSSFEGMQRLAELNLATTREFFNNSVANANTLLAAKDVNEVAELNGRLAKPGFEKLVDYSRRVYELVAQMQKEVTSVMESQYGQFQKDARNVIDRTKTTPVGGDIYAATMKSMLDQTNKAFENLNAMTRQMAEIAEASIQNTTAATAKAVGAATRSAAGRTPAKK